MMMRHYMAAIALAVAMGPWATPSLADGTEVGNAIANGSDRAIAIGSNTNPDLVPPAIADGDNAIAVGNGAGADGPDNTAIGSGTRAGGPNGEARQNASAFGARAKALEADATAIGTDSTASGKNSTAVGQRSKASGDDSWL